MALKAEHLAIDKFDGKNYTVSWRSRFKAKLAMINEEYDWMFDFFEKFDRTIIEWFSISIARYLNRLITL